MSPDIIAVYSTMGFLVTINLGICGYLWNTMGRLQRDFALALSAIREELQEDRKDQARSAVSVAEKMATREELRDVIRDQTTQLIREMDARMGPRNSNRRFGDGHD